MALRVALLAALCGTTACTVPLVGFGDSGPRDGSADARASDLGSADGATTDLGAASDGGTTPDATIDATAPDSGPTDAGPIDLGTIDLGCVGGEVETLYFLDCDRDNYGGTMEMLSCGPPAIRPPCGGGSLGIWTTRAGDCDDASRQAHPGQLSYYTAPHGAGGGATSYDYDCDGVETPQYTGTGGFLACMGMPGPGMTCDSLTGWEGAVPACGATGTLRTCVADLAGGCAVGSTTTRAQACR